VALPDFLVVGAPKAGTTALHAALAAHPQLFMSRVKEPRYFLCEDGVPPPRRGGPGDAQTYQEYVWRRRDYEALFEGRGEGMLAGESSPFYLWDRDAHRRIRAVIPDAKLIAVLRDPVERAYSNWAHLWSAGLEPCHDFIEACGREPERIAAGWAPFWRYLELGRYGEQLRDLFRVFLRDQLLILRYRELRDEPAAALTRVCEFLGISPGLISAVPRENVRPHIRNGRATLLLQELLRAGAGVGQYFPPPVRRLARGPVLAALQRRSRAREPLTRDQRAELIARLAPDVRRLERVTGRYFGDWLEADGAVEGALLGHVPA
jgi:hypothetical protein